MKNTHLRLRLFPQGDVFLHPFRIKRFPETNPPGARLAVVVMHRHLRPVFSELLDLCKELKIIP
jgi:hypothetical protein